MKVNWPERLWVNSPVRRLVQEREARFFREIHPSAPGGRYLEIGCGCGVGAGIICRSFSPAAIFALDIDPEMLRAARRKKKVRQNSSLHLMAADAQELPFPDGSFDAVFNYGIIHHLEDWQKGIAEISRVLRQNGVFYFEEIYPPLYANFLLRRLLVHPRENRFHGPQYRAALDAAGLRLLEGYKESRFAILGAAVKEE
jgi:ubiquinone/menaquinone biosynthesis C-methylase UbiE